MATKVVYHTPEFMNAALQEPERALAYMFFSAFGFTLEDAEAVLKEIVKKKDWAMVPMLYAASVQIRGNISFVSANGAWNQIDKHYPKLIIKGSRQVPDSYNFGALHITGHLMCHVCNTWTWADKALEKNGDCIFDKFKNDSWAGEINKDIYDEWSTKQKDNARLWIQENSKSNLALLAVSEVMPDLSSEFVALLGNDTPSTTFKDKLLIKSTDLGGTGAGATGKLDVSKRKPITPDPGSVQ